MESHRDWRFQFPFLLVYVIFVFPGMAQIQQNISRDSLSVCCQVGVHEASGEDLSDPSRIAEVEADECSIIDGGADLIAEVRSEDQKTKILSEKQCSLVKMSCYLATRASAFCAYTTSLTKITPTTSTISNGSQNFDPDRVFERSFLEIALACCTSSKLPTMSIWPDGNLALNDAGVPSCCIPSDYSDYPDPFADLEESEPKNMHISKAVVTTNTLNSSSHAFSATTTTSASTNMATTTATTTTPATTDMISHTQQISEMPTSISEEETAKPKKGSANETVECELGFKWYPEKRLCIHMKTKCPRGMFLSAKLNMCLPKENASLSCPQGYVYRDDLKECEDVDECVDGVFQTDMYTEACSSPAQVCENLPGSFACKCKPGYQVTIDGSECIDIDECVTNRTACKQGYKCRNVIGSFQCIRQVPCGFGYVLNPETQECEDIDECKMQPDICGPNMLCINVRGGLKCVREKCPEKQRRNAFGKCAPCPTGYEFNEKLGTCEDINECALNSTLCRTFEKCSNRPGDYVCEPKLRCTWGMQINQDGSQCVDVDECTMQAFNCHPREICVNVVGSYRCAPSPCHYTEVFNYEIAQCACAKGYRHRNGECVDVDECAEEVAGVQNLNPLCRGGKTCLNVPGSYRCVTITDCPEGFKRISNRDPCIDIDECKENIAKCGVNMHCENTIGSYKCLCARGFKNMNESSCVDIDECKVFRADESCPDPRARCVNTAGSYKCICPDGFVWHGYPINRCRDVNECVLGTHVCGTLHRCVNEEGSYRCECATGYRIGWDKRTCIDIDECLDPVNVRTCRDGICVNVLGGFRCDCPTGYRLNSQNNCVDVNECQEREDICDRRQSRRLPSYTCVNLHGGYRCLTERCQAMYTMEKLRNGYRCRLNPEHECSNFHPSCVRDRPLRIENIHHELVSPMPVNQVIGEIDSSLVYNGTVHVELLHHYAHQMRTNLHLSIENALKLRLKSPNSRFIEVVLQRALEAPADILVSVRLFEIRGRLKVLKSISKFYIFTSESAQNQAAFERQQRRFLRNRG